MQRINFTETTLTTLKRNARCSFANAVYKLTMKAQQGLKCDDLFKKSVLMNEVNKLLCKYKLDECISFHPFQEGGISTWTFGVGDISPYIWEIYLNINDVVTLIGEGTDLAEIAIDINANTETTGVSAELSEDGDYMTVYSPPGCFVKADLIRSTDKPGAVPASQITFVAGKCPQIETCVEYTEEELNCITPQDLQLLFEFTHKYKETLAKSTKRITSPSTSSSSPSPSDCCNWGSIGGSIGNQSDLVAYLQTIEKNFIAAYDETTLLSNDIKSLKFLGPGVTATNSGGDISITIPGGGGGIPDLQQVTTVGSTTTVGITVDNGTESVEIKHDRIKIVNASSGEATITSPTLTTATEFRIPDKATGPQTFAMMSDITSGSGIPHATASGVDAYTATVSGVTTYNDGDAYLIRFTNGNTTSATLNISGAGVVPLYRNNDGQLIGGDIWDGGEMLCVYNSTLNIFQCIGTSPNSIFAYVTNAESVTTITKGQVVYAFGGAGDRMTVKLANNTSDATSARTVGVVLSASIAANQKGIIILQGLLDGLSTLKPSVGSWADGDIVYLSNTAGGITRTKQYAPNHMVYIGTVTTASNGTSGRMYVKIQNGYELDELHNVQAQSPTLKDTLWYDNTVSPAQWKTASIATILGYTPMTNPMTTIGDIIYGGVSGVPTRLAAGTNGHVLTLSSGSPIWAASGGGGGGMTNPMTNIGDIIIGSTSGSPIRLGAGSNGQVLSLSSGSPVWSTEKGSFGVTFDGQGGVVSVGKTDWVSIPYNCTITGWEITADQIGSCVIDVWKSTFAAFPPTVANSIAGSEKPTLASARTNRDVSLSPAWATVTAGDCIMFYVESCSTLTKINLIVYTNIII
jgi:hypothetical protein